jgi:hypothetical protein
LDHLHGLKSLHRLFIGGTRVADAAVARLQKALPKLKINR